MKKKFILILSFTLIFLSVFMGGCKRKEKNTDEIISRLKELGNYSCSFEMVMKNLKQELVYSGKQFYNKDIGYRVELGEDRVQIYKEDKIYINDLKSGSRYVAEKDFDNVFKLTFINEYIGLLYTNEEIVSSVKIIGEEKYQLIELLIPGGIRELNKAVLYVNTKKYLPEKLIIYDINEKEKLNVIYKDFNTNANLNKDLFNTK